MVLHFPTARQGGGTKSQEMDFIVGKKVIITARYEVIDPIHNLHKVFEAEELLGMPRGENKEQVLLERIFRRLYGALGAEVEEAARRLEVIEREDMPIAYLPGNATRIHVKVVGEMGANHG